MRIQLKVLLFSVLMAFAAPAFAQIHLSINIGPPPPRREVVVEAPYEGAVWIAGYYVYDRSLEDYQWSPGRWQAPPAPQQVWVAPRYVRNGNHVDYYEGRWHDNGHGKGDRHDNGKHKGQEKQQDRQAHDEHGR